MRKRIPHVIMATLTILAGLAIILPRLTQMSSQQRVTLPVVGCFDDANGTPSFPATLSVTTNLPHAIAKDAQLHGLPTFKNAVILSPKGWTCKERTVGNQAVIDVQPAAQPTGQFAPHYYIAMLVYKNVGVYADAKACGFYGEAQRALLVTMPQLADRARTVCAPQDGETIVRRAGHAVYFNDIAGAPGNALFRQAYNTTYNVMAYDLYGNPKDTSHATVYEVSCSVPEKYRAYCTAGLHLSESLHPFDMP